MTDIKAILITFFYQNTTERKLTGGDLTNAVALLFFKSYFQFLCRIGLIYFDFDTVIFKLTCNMNLAHLNKRYNWSRFQLFWPTPVGLLFSTFDTSPLLQTSTFDYIFVKEEI